MTEVSKLKLYAERVQRRDRLHAEVEWGVVGPTKYTYTVASVAAVAGWL